MSALYLHSDCIVSGVPRICITTYGTLNVLTVVNISGSNLNIKITKKKKEILIFFFFFFIFSLQKNKIKNKNLSAAYIIDLFF